MTIFKKNNEEKIVDIQFDVHKFSNREKPTDPNKILIISCFSEFGCEVLGSMYCIPRIIAEHSDMYYIVMGWYGRNYLYKHLVDEFWEVKEEFQWLREKSLAFHHNSKNLSRIEKVTSKLGKVVKADSFGKIAVGNSCQKCSHFWGQVEGVMYCPKCGNRDLVKSLFGNIPYWKEQVVRIPKPSLIKSKQADSYLGKNPVGIIARNRKTYGRNLQPEFYVKLIKLLEQMEYNPIWLGEKQTTLPCPLPHIIDLSRKEECRDLELTLAIVAKLKFTVQFWTASTRLAGIVGTPYLIIESPDQLFGNGQEGYRLALCTFGKKKIALCHYLNVFNNNDATISLVKRCIDEMNHGDWSDVIGLIDEPELVKNVREKNIHRLCGI